MDNDKLAAWQDCHVGSCQRHQECMYSPCRNVPVSLDADTAGLVEYTGSPELGTPDPTALRTITAERDALAKRVAELEVSVELAAVWFEGYANAHYAKAINAPDGKEQHSREVKGKANADRAKELRATLKGTDHV